MKNVIKMEIWYDTETQHLFINENPKGKRNVKEAAKEIQNYFASQYAKIKIQEAVDRVL